MNNTQQQQAQQFVQQPQGGQKTQPLGTRPQTPVANDEMAKIAQLGYN